MRIPRTLPQLCVPMLALALAPSLRAQVVPHVHVAATVEEGVASVQVALTLENQGKGEAEYVLAFPLPEGAVADELELMIDGKKEKGEIADANTARGVYLSIVRKRRDPALLEYAGRGLVRLRVFPIPGGGKREVTLGYRQVLPQAGGLWSLQFPTRAFGKGRFAMDVRLKSQHGLRNVYAPTSGWDIVRKGDNEARASFESGERPSNDPQLFYSLSDKEFGLSLLSCKQQGKPGYFLMLLSPKREGAGQKELSKSITFVVDVSGSMRGQKIEQAKGALRYFVSKLGANDEFNIVAFSTEATPWQQQLMLANAENKKGAEDFITKLDANGGTNIHDALTAALAVKPKEGHVPMLVFLTDGLASVGIQQPKAILEAVAKANAHATRIFAFGVGNDVNTFLIDSLCEQSHGTRDYVAQDEDIEIKTGALFDKIAHPVLTELKLSCDGAKLSRLAPHRLPDLFRGEQLVIAGRYEEPGQTAITLTGRDGESVQSYTFDASFAKDGAGHDFVPSIWAQRRVGFLLDQMRLHGQNQELISEVKRLADEHGIVTPYSSQLVLEPGMQGDSFGGPVPPPAPGTGLRRHGMTSGAPGKSGGVPAPVGNPAQGGPTTPAPAGPATGGGGGMELARGRRASGAKAVADSKKSKELQDKEQLEESEVRKRVAGKTFVKKGEGWVDTAWKPEMLTELRSVEAWSEEYLKLLKEQPELAPFLALEGRILLVLKDGKALEIYPEGKKPTPRGKDEGKAESKGK